MKGSNRPHRFIIASILTALVSWTPAAFSQRETLMQQPLLSVAGKQFSLLRIELAPLTGNDGSAPGHRHPGDTIVYVESGTVTNQMNDDAVKEYRAGEFWYEAPGELHSQFMNTMTTAGSSGSLFLN